MFLLVLSLRRLSPLFIRCVYAVFGYKIFWRLYTTFVDHILHSTSIYYFCWPYTTFDGYILFLTARYYFRRLCTTFTIKLLGFCKIQIFATISFICLLNSRLEFNINLLALIQFCFFCSSMVSSLNFNLPFWKSCFIRNTQMLKTLNFQALKKRT